MNISLNPEAQRLVEERLRTGKYATAEDVVTAALANLGQQESELVFPPDELARLVSEGEESIQNEGTLDAAEVFSELRRLSAQRRGELE